MYNWFTSTNGDVNPYTKQLHINKDINKITKILHWIKRLTQNHKIQDLEPYILKPINIFIYPPLQKLSCFSLSTSPKK